MPSRALPLDISIDFKDLCLSGGSSEDEVTPLRETPATDNSTEAPKPRRPEASRLLFKGESSSSLSAEEEADDEEFMRQRQRMKARSADIVSSSPPRTPRHSNSTEMSPLLGCAMGAGMPPSLVVDQGRTASASAHRALPAPPKIEHEFWSLADCLAILSGWLDLNSALALASTSSRLNSVLMAEPSAWQPHAEEVGLWSPHVGKQLLRGASARQLVARMRDAHELRAGDLLEVMDTYCLWATARLGAVLPLRDLLLVHFEGYSDSWLMWVHRRRDAARLRPLSRACPMSGDGASPRGPHSPGSFHRVFEKARALLLDRSGTSVWELPGRPDGERSSWPSAYEPAGPAASSDAEGAGEQHSCTRVVCLTLSPAEAVALAWAPVRPFLVAREYAKDRGRCSSVYHAAVRESTLAKMR